MMIKQKEAMSLPARRETPASLFDSIRRGFETVTGMADHVRVREDMIPAYAQKLAPLAKEKIFDTTHHYHGDAENMAAYVLMLDSVNFGSGFEPGMVREGWQLVDDSLYFTLATNLKRYFEQEGKMPAAALAELSPQECIAFLGLNGKGPYSYEFVELCTGSLRELGAMIETAYGGTFMAMVENACGSAEAMVRQLSQLSHFNDVHNYHGHEISFYKRGQITAADLHVSFKRQGRDLFFDINRLTMFADNAVPHVLYMDGLLEYDPALAVRIAKGQDIPSGAPEEVEIRACAGYVVERIAACKGMTAVDIDLILWHKSAEEPRYREKSPHRTLSVYY